MNNEFFQNNRPLRLIRSDSVESLIGQINTNK